MTCGGSTTVAAYLVDPLISQLTAAGQLVGSNPGARGYIGCYQDASTGKLLSDWGYYTSGLTTQTCLQLCTAQGYAVSLDILTVNGRLPN
jgi:energy-converting hydrogenase Eha subunit B